MVVRNNGVLAMGTIGNGLFNIFRDRNDFNIVYAQNNMGVKLDMVPYWESWKRRSKLESVDKD